MHNTPAVARGHGDVGKSTVAVNLTVALRELGATVGLLDWDIYGTNVSVVSMGFPTHPGQAVSAGWAVVRRRA